MEDIGDGDHSSLACIPPESTYKAQLLIKEDGILAGVELALEIFKRTNPALKVDVLIQEGSPVKKGDFEFVVFRFNDHIPNSHFFVLLLFNSLMKYIYIRS